MTEPNIRIFWLLDALLDEFLFSDEIYVNSLIRNRMELNIFADNRNFFTIQNNFNIHIIKTSGIQSFFNFNRMQRNHNRLLLSTINNGRNTTLTTTCTSCPLTCFFSFFCIKSNHFIFLFSIKN